jgi:hypothetical protein
MPQPVLVSDATVEVSFGSDPQSVGGAGSIPSTPTVDYQCYATSVRVTLSGRTIDLSTLCSTTEATFQTGQTGTLELELFVDETNGPIFLYKEGYLCKVKIVPGGAGSTLTYQGLVTDVSNSFTPGEVERETATVKLGAFGFSATYA